LPKPPKLSAQAVAAVRTRRAYFDCQYGQLHVRTAFPTTGGFDEQVTLFCLHPRLLTSRVFSGFLAEIAVERSVYAPDLPGCGESDPPPSPSFADAAAAISDLANDLRLRQIDVLGFQDGSAAAIALAALRPELVRRLVLVGVPPAESLPRVMQQCWVLRLKGESSAATGPAGALLPNAQFVDAAQYAPDMFDTAPKILARRINEFLNRDAPLQSGARTASVGPGGG
jgi:pimeloyl-ACP methyl ester carboxylesterase